MKTSQTLYIQTYMTVVVRLVVTKFWLTYTVGRCTMYIVYTAAVAWSWLS